MPSAMRRTIAVLADEPGSDQKRLTVSNRRKWLRDRLLHMRTASSKSKYEFLAAAGTPAGAGAGERRRRASSLQLASPPVTAA